MRKISILVVTALVAVTLAAAPASAKPGKGTPDKYVPKAGPAFNNPYGSRDAIRRLIIQVNRTVDSVPKGGKIRISAWNVRSASITNSLIRAHNRKVSVQVVMDRANWNPNNPNVDAARLSAALKKGNKNRSKTQKSFLRRCIGSCRGKHGIPHSKYFLFNKVKTKKNGKVKIVPFVTMYGSYNATELGATIQWNDLFTIKNDEARYKSFLTNFNEMVLDKPVKNAYTGYDDGVIGTGFYPYVGAEAVAKDPVMAMLNQISCKGATTNKNGTTRIRIAQTSMYGDRGLKLARKLARLQKQGCNIRIVYAMFGNEVLRILRSARVPLTHLAYDSDNDGLYDRYVHMKTMAISGNYAGDPGAKVTFNGSANWTSVALASDEVVGFVRQKWVTNRYMQWIDYMFTHRPKVWGPEHPGNNGNAPVGRVKAGSLDPFPSYEARVAATDQYDAIVKARAKKRGVDPYALIKEEN
ncbi:phospholipase D-like domain-containing protein [Nocardioides hwasunensis]|uniref:Phospholipase D-like domain-containing protein n=1 Tax=Nocardioides hwasunensis TaxID=397258 RepID=A0ABR8MED6_9ACTN|nr:phospholipase D-like domain-containing protein [Nocardioides hwasunensis]MBD3914327.1 hypothetical protein [Nocardioides hwasunensis]